MAVLMTDVYGNSNTGIIESMENAGGPTRFCNVTHTYLFILFSARAFIQLYANFYNNYERNTDSKNGLSMLSAAARLFTEEPTTAHYSIFLLVRRHQSGTVVAQSDTINSF